MLGSHRGHGWFCRGIGRLLSQHLKQLAISFLRLAECTHGFRPGIALLGLGFWHWDGNLLPGAQRRNHQVPGATFLAVALVMLVEQREGAFGGRSRAGERRG